MLLIEAYNDAVSEFKRKLRITGMLACRSRCGSCLNRGSPVNESPTLKHTEPTPPELPSLLRGIFIGDNGLRARWSLSIFLVLFLALAFAFDIINHSLHLYEESGLSNTAGVPAAKAYIESSAGFLAALFATWVMSKIERRPISIYGLGGRRKLRLFLTGLGCGVVCYLLLGLTLWSSGLMVFDGRLLFGGDILRYGTIWLFGFLTGGLSYEYFFRGYLQYTLTRGLSGFCQRALKTRHSATLGFWIAAAITSLLFALLSILPGEPPIAFVSLGLFGMVACFSLWRTGSLWWIVGFHMAWDWTQSFLFGAADSGERVQHRLLATHPAGRPIFSGGTTGPECSIFIVPTLALVVLIILFCLPRGRYGEMLDRPTSRA